MAQEEAVNSVVDKVVDLVFGKAKEEISYMWNCSKSVEDLETKKENLTLMKGRVLQQITAAEDREDRLLVGVEEWVAKAESHITEAEKVIKGFDDNANKTCLNLGMCMDLGTLYHYGKAAANEARSLLRHQKDGEEFESCVAVPIPAPGVLDVYDRRNIDGLDTHKRCFENILESIQDEKIQIIGIYGIGGVGKTTLAKEVAVEVKSLNLFDAVEFITVSQPVDAERIKKEVEVAAKRIKNGKKVLVILDDLWGELKLDDVGIPCGAGYKKCKILLTSRRKDVCETMNATRLISVDSLQPNESWILFKRVVGDIVETTKFKEIAEKVVEGCGGLPLIIQVVGAALKNKRIKLWEIALTQIQKHTTPDIDPTIRIAYSHLQLSYDFLESEEAKLCFLLCSLFPEDYNIPLERLALYGVGLKIFKNLGSVEDARIGVRREVEYLKSASLLLDGKDESTVKMHDVVREVALLIASKGRHKFLVKAGIGLTEWQPRPESVKSCTGISLMNNRIRKLPDYELEIPQLDIFLIQGNDLSAIHDDFILGVKEARVLDFQQNEIVSLPPSLKLLTKLRMLNLGGNKSLCNIFILGVLKSLEILILSHTGIVQIPQEIGDLVRLRRLEVKGCHRLCHIAQGVMSKLRWLQELHIAYYAVKDKNNEGLMEIGELSMLTFVDLFVPHIRLLPTEGVCFRKLKGFVIQIGGDSQLYDAAEVVHKKTLILGMEDLDESSMLEVKELIELSDGIIFDSVVNLNIVPRGSLDDLTTIMLSKCHNLSSLEELGGGESTKKQFFSKLEHLFLVGLDMLHVLWNCPDQLISLKNLVTLDIFLCDKLEKLFSVNVAQGLVNLQTLTIHKCSSLKEVIWDEDAGDNNKVVFRCLVKIELSYLSSLKSFYAGEVTIEYPSLVNVEIYGCNLMEKWDYNGTIAPNLKLVNQHPIDQAQTQNEYSDAFPPLYFGDVFVDRIKQVVGLKEWPEYKRVQVE